MESPLSPTGVGGRLLGANVQRDAEMGDFVELLDRESSAIPDFPFFWFKSLGSSDASLALGFPERLAFQ